MTTRLVGRVNMEFSQELEKDDKYILAWICFRLMIELSPDIFESTGIIPKGYDNETFESLQHVNVDGIAYEVFQHYMESGRTQQTDTKNIVKRIFNDVCYVYIPDHDFLVAKQRFRDIYHKFLDAGQLTIQLKHEAEFSTFFLRDDGVRGTTSENSYFVDFI